MGSVLISLYFRNDFAERDDKLLAQNLVNDDNDLNTVLIVTAVLSNGAVLDNGLVRLLVAVTGEEVQQPVGAPDHVSQYGCHACDVGPAPWRTGLVLTRRLCRGSAEVVVDMPRQLL